MKLLKNIKSINIVQICLSLLILGMSLNLAAQDKTAKLNVVATTTIIYDIAANIDNRHRASLKCLMPLGGDPHIYEPTPKDARLIAESNVVLKNGFFLEGWLNKLIDNAGGTRLVVEVCKGSVPISNDKFHHAPDPHAWMDPVQGKIYAENIYKTLAQAVPEYADEFKSNYTAYAAKLDELDAYIRTQLNRIPAEHRVLVTSHDAFRYFSRRYGIEVEAALGTSTDAEVQVGDMQHLIDVINEKKIPAIFIESTINPKLLEQIAADNHVKIGGKLFSDSLGDSTTGASTYLDMLRYNTDTLVNALVNSVAEKPQENSLTALFITVIGLFIVGFGWLYAKIVSGKRTIKNWQNFSIDVENISVSYYKKTVLSNINLSLSSGKLYGLLGPNGAGKSTFFKSILGLVKADSGRILINGSPIDEVRDKIAYIPQKEEIDWTFPATVIDIVLTGRLPMKGVFETYNASDKQMATEALEKLGMAEFSDRQIKDLSGGQQQRVFIARALCQQAEILMFDEPFVGVDITTEEKIVQIIKNLVLDNKTVLIIHHDLSKVKDYFDYVIMINQRLIACGKTEEVFIPENITLTYGGRLTILQETDTLR